MDTPAFIPQSAPQPEPPRRSRIVIAAAIVLLVVALVAGGLVWAWGTYGSLSAAWSSLFPPRDISSAVFVGYDAEGSAHAYRMVSGHAVAVPVPAGLIALALSPKHTAALAQLPGSYELSFDGKTLLSSSSTLAFVAVSPDGSRIALSQSSLPAATSTAPVPEPLITPSTPGWNIALVPVDHPEQKTVLAPGSGAVYAKGLLVWMDPRGIVGMELAGGREHVLVATTSTTLAAPVLASADGTHIAVHDLGTRRILVYRLSGTTASLETSVPDRSAPSFALGNDAVYFTRVNPSVGTEIWMAPFAGPATRVSTLPASLRITRIILPSP